MRFFGHFMPMISDGIFFAMSGQENAIIARAQIEDLGAFWIFSETCVLITESEISGRLA